MFATSCWFMIFFCEFLNLEESDCEESIGDDGSSGEGEDSGESDTTGMIFFLVLFFPVSFSSVIFPSFILDLVPMACNTVEEMAHTSIAYLVIAWQTGHGPIQLLFLLLVVSCPGVLIPPVTLFIVLCPGIQCGGLRGSRHNAGHGFCVIIGWSNMKPWDI